MKALSFLWMLICLTGVAWAGEKQKGVTRGADKTIEVFSTNYSQFLGCYIAAQDRTGTFLGQILPDSTNTNSIINDFGPYGSSTSPTSIRNNFGLYGSQFQPNSAYNSYAITPPAIYTFNGGVAKVIGFLTKNQFLATSLPKVDPDGLINYLKSYTVPVFYGPDLLFVNVAELKGVVVLSKSIGSNSSDTVLTDRDDIYMSVAIANDGDTVAPQGWLVSIFLDNVKIDEYTALFNLLPHYYQLLSDVPIGKLSLGSHILTVVIDQNNYLNEFIRFNNAINVRVNIYPYSDARDWALYE